MNAKPMSKTAEKKRIRYPRYKFDLMYLNRCEEKVSAVGYVLPSERLLKTIRDYKLSTSHMRLYEIYDRACCILGQCYQGAAHFRFISAEHCGDGEQILSFRVCVRYKHNHTGNTINTPNKTNATNASRT